MQMVRKIGLGTEKFEICTSCVRLITKVRISFEREKRNAGNIDLTGLI